MPEAIIIYLLLGCFAGLIAGLLGVGGGLIIVPVLAVVFQAQAFDHASIMHVALGTSLATIVFTAISAVLAHHRRGAVVWSMVFALVPGLLMGSLFGALFADGIPSDDLKLVFALFEFVVACYMIAGAPSPQRSIEALLRRFEPFVVGNGIGLVSAILGIGGGTMMVPYLCWRGRTIRQAVAISSACGMPIALAGAFGYFIAGMDADSLPAMATGYIYWPAVIGIVTTSLLFAPLGARLAHSLPKMFLKRVFGVVLLLMAVTMFAI